MMITTRKSALVTFGIVLALMVIAVPTLPAQDQTEKETFEGWAVSTGNLATGRNSTVQINITRWTTDEERQQLIETLVEDGSDEALKLLQQQEETGYMRLVGPASRLTAFPTTRLHFAREIRDGKTRIIRLVTDRPIGYYEARSNPRSMDYNFTVLELRLDENNEGEGRLAVGVKVMYDKETRTIKLENYSSEPIRLSEIRKR
jgi:hypothetical protein